MHLYSELGNITIPGISAKQTSCSVTYFVCTCLCAWGRWKLSVWHRKTTDSHKADSWASTDDCISVIISDHTTVLGLWVKPGVHINIHSCTQTTVTPHSQNPQLQFEAESLLSDENKPSFCVLILRLTFYICLQSMNLLDLLMAHWHQ